MGTGQSPHQALAQSVLVAVVVLVVMLGNVTWHPLVETCPSIKVV